MKVSSLDKALEYFNDGITIMYGGFGGIGNPPTLINGIIEKGVTDLHLIGNDVAFPDIGIGRLIQLERAKSLIVSHIGSNPIAGQQMTEGKLKVEFSPQGTLAERIRAGGMGLGGILTDTGIDSILAENKKRIDMNGITYLIEPALTADVSIVYAKKADTFGNLIFDMSARNTNPLVAQAGNITIVEADEIVQEGELNPEEIVTSGVFVDMVIQSQGVDWKWVWE
ncbi:acetate CoA/acetoacetate CoA-transferase alpha subunit [Salirhabdus euzebyi]|uniref:Acetate CoA/acetoacetate CoA-transferase alpha subunit n=1 Tax=Salirhabdus euzebyi TaxID=394506 RepID=A0A841Q4U0_9BACI|nr:CoA transferase subunit A [Salirhabdus euzebyi]MBB6453370.1 acetate CoA/acetoacetate CoA-transferase alpha subunit [Salirhabdus euzebyi]